MDKPKRPRGRPKKNTNPENDVGTSRQQKDLIVRKPSYLNMSCDDIFNSSFSSTGGSVNQEPSSENACDEDSMGLVISNVTSIRENDDDSDCIEVSSSDEEENMHLGELQYAGEDEYMVVLNEDDNENSNEGDNQDENSAENDDLEEHEVSVSCVNNSDSPAGLSCRAGSLQSAVCAN